MNKVQFFYNDELIAMERKINKWLAANKDIEIFETNLTAIGKPSQRAGVVATEKYVFYIRYRTTREMAISTIKHEEAISSIEVDPNLGLKIVKN